MSGPDTLCIRLIGLILALAAPIVASAATAGVAEIGSSNDSWLDAPREHVPEPVRAFAAKNLPPGQVLPTGPLPGSPGAAVFGFSISFNSVFAVIGAPGEPASAGQPGRGAAYVFSRTNAGWRFMQRLLPSGPTASATDLDGFGVSVDVYSDRLGSQIVIGASGDDDDVTGAVDAGAIYVFDLRRVVLPGGGPALNWTARKIIASAANTQLTAGAFFGSSVRTENRIIAAGAPFTPTATFPASSPGQVYVTSCSLGATGSCMPGVLLQNAAGVIGERFGASLALSRRFLVVGAPARPLGTSGEAGAVAVYSNINGNVGFETTLTPADLAPGDNFGTSVSLFRNSILVGASGDDVPDPRAGSISDAGSARLFVRATSTPTWTQRELFTALVPTSGAGFGISVGMHARRAVVGALRRNPQNSAGMMTVFEQERLRWVFRDEIFAVGAEPAQFYGFSVAAGPGGAFLGAPFVAATANNPNQGRAAWYPLGNAAIARRGNPDTAAPAGDQYGASTAILGDFLVVGVPEQDYNIGVVAPIPITNGGEVRILNRSGARGFNAVGFLRMPLADAVSNARFGARVALSRNGDVLVVSAPGATVGTVAGAGAVYVFERTGLTNYTLVFRLAAPTPTAGTGFGLALDITPNGNVVFVGAPDFNGGRGMVYRFLRGAPIGKSATPISKGGDPFDGGGEIPPPSGGAPGDKWGSAVATDGGNTVVGTPGDNGGDGSINVLDGDGSGNYGAGTTVDPPPDQVPGDEQGFGSSVDVDDGVVAVGAPNTDAPPSAEQGGNQADAGTAYAYPVSDDPPAGPPSTGEPTELTPPVSSSGDKWGTDVGTAGGTVVVGAPGADVPTDTTPSVDQGAGASYSCTGDSGTDGECPPTSFLFGAGADTGEGVGTSVSIDENQNVVLGAPTADAGASADAGAIYTAEPVFDPDALLVDGFD
jgi:hypothetical protein